MEAARLMRNDDVGIEDVRLVDVDLGTSTHVVSEKAFARRGHLEVGETGFSMNVSRGDTHTAAAQLLPPNSPT
jgi:hypothetical protein